MSEARYGNTRVAKIRAVYNELRSALAGGDLEAAQAAFARYEQWSDYILDKRHSDRISALEASVKVLKEALDERQDSGRNFWMKWTQKRLETKNAMFLRDAKLALGGDMRALRTRVEMMEAEPMQVVLSAALQENTDE